MTEELKRLNVNLDPDTHRLFKLAATAAGTDMTEVLKELIEQYIRAVDSWIAFALLGFVGIRMVIAGWSDQQDEIRNDPTKSYTMVLLSVATSIDAFAIGVTLAMMRVEIWYPSFVIGIITACLSFFALKIGSRLSSAFGKRMEIAGGLIIALIGVKLLIEGLMQ